MSRRSLWSRMGSCSPDLYIAYSISYKRDSHVNQHFYQIKPALETWVTWSRFEAIFAKFWLKMSSSSSYEDLGSVSGTTSPDSECATTTTEDSEIDPLDGDSNLEMARVQLILNCTPVQDLDMRFMMKSWNTRHWLHTKEGMWWWWSGVDFYQKAAWALEGMGPRFGEEGWRLDCIIWPKPTLHFTTPKLSFLFSSQTRHRSIDASGGNC